MDKLRIVNTFEFVRILAIVLLCMELAKLGLSYDLEETRTTYSACYSSSEDSILNASCPNNTYIFPYYVGTGVKTNNCSDILSSGQVMSTAEEDRCCKTPNATGDCVHRYTNEEKPYLIENLCVGRNQCDKTLVPHDTIANMNCSSSFNVTNRDSSYTMITYYCIEGQRIRTPFSPPFNNDKMIYLILSCRPELYTRGIVSIKSRCEIQGSQIEVWLIDLRLNIDSKQSIVLSNETLSIVLSNETFNVSIDAMYKSPFTPRPLTDVGGSTALNVTFDTTNNEFEFLWLGFKAASGDVSLECLDLRPRAYIQVDVPSLPSDQKLRGLQIGAAAGGAAFVVVVALVISMAYKRWRRSKKCHRCR